MVLLAEVPRLHVVAAAEDQAVEVRDVVHARSGALQGSTSPTERRPVANCVQASRVVLGLAVSLLDDSDADHLCRDSYSPTSDIRSRRWCGKVLTRITTTGGTTEYDVGHERETPTSRGNARACPPPSSGTG